MSRVRQTDLMRRVQALAVLFGMVLACLSVAAWGESVERDRTSGVVVSLTLDTIGLRQADGAVVVLALDPDYTVVSGQAIGRRDVVPGDTVGVAAYVVPVSPTI